MKPIDDRSQRRFLKKSSMLGFAVALSPGTIVEAFANSRIELIQEENTMTQTTATQQGSEQTAVKNAIRPFHVKVPEEELNELRRRINVTKWPEREVVPDASQGVQLDTMQKLARYWANDYDWRKIEAKLILRWLSCSQPGEQWLSTTVLRTCALCRCSAQTLLRSRRESDTFTSESTMPPGRTIIFQNVPVEPWGDELLKRGLPVHLVNHLATMADLHRAGRYDRVTDDILTLTGQRLLSVQFVRKNAAAFTASAKAA